MAIVKTVKSAVPSANQSDLMKVASMAIVANFADAVATPYLGGGDIRSAVMKIGAGYALNKFVGGDIASIVGGGLIVTGVTDAVEASGLADAASGFGGKVGGVGTPAIEENW